MGGFGSGRNEYALTPTDRECLKLPVDGFTDILNGDHEEQVSGTCGWGDKREIAWQTIKDVDDEGIRFLYDAGSGDDQRRETYPVWIERTECNFGGSRPWFLCPAPTCNERVGKLYLPPGERKFLCRHCHDFGYHSSRISGNPDRTHRMRYNRARKKLGGESAHPEADFVPTPDRPKGMHENTYEKLADEMREARDDWYEEAFYAPLRRYADRVPFDVEV